MNGLEDLAAALPEQETSSGANAPLPNRSRRASKAAMAKKRDSHKRHLSEKTKVGALKQRLDAKRYFPEEDLLYVLEECRQTIMQQPAREVEVQIDTPSLDEVCVHTVDYLYTVGKVQPVENDAANLKKVIQAQCATKVALARRHNGKVVDVSETEYVNRVEKKFTVLPKVTNIYVEQVGQFECEGQMFVPKKLPVSSFNRLAEGRYLTGLTRNSPEGYKEVAIAIPVAMHVTQYVNDGVFTGDAFTMVTNGHGTVEWVREDSIGDFRSLCAWYESFINRCSRKAASLLQPVIFGKGEGTVAQLVGSKFDVASQQREVWCAKKIDQNILQLGGLFGYGWLSNDKFHDPDIACVIDRISDEGLYQRIQRCQKL